MQSIQIYVIDHRPPDDHQPEGDIIRPWKMIPGGRYADFQALQEVWEMGYTPPDIVGFMGYRKYLWEPSWFRPGRVEPAHAPFFCQTGRKEFDDYRGWWSKWDGDKLRPLLAQHDVLQGASFSVPSLLADFAISRSAHDADMFCAVLDRHGWSPMSQKIYPYLFITRWPVFTRMMRTLEPIRRELDPLVTAEDSENVSYRRRPMAYIMERVYSLWLKHSGLDIYEVPLLHCWEL